MPRSSSYPLSSPSQLPLLQGQGPDNFKPFSMEPLLTAEEAAAYLKVTERTVYQFITGDRPNKLRAAWVGRRWLITETALRDFISENQRDESQLK